MIIEIYSDQFNILGGGGQHRILTIARGLRNLGYDIVFVTPYYKATFEELFRNPLKYSIDLAWLYYTKRGKAHYYADNALLLPLRSLSSNLALIVLPSPIFKGNVVFSKKLFRKAPTIIDFGDVWFTEKDSNAYKTLSIKYFEHLLKTVHAAVFPTGRFMKFFQHLVPWYKSKCVHIPTPIDTDLFKPLRKSSTPVIVYVGSLNPGRGVELLPQIVLKTVKLVGNVKFLVIGSGILEPWLRREVVKCNVERFVKFIGEVKFNEIPYIAGSGWIGLSLYPKPAPYPVDILKSLVYMSLGMPIVSSTIVEEASDVSIRVPHDPEAFASAINALVTRSEMLKELSIKARNKAVTEFSLEVVTAKYHLLIKRIV